MKKLIEKFVESYKIKIRECSGVGVTGIDKNLSSG